MMHVEVVCTTDDPTDSLKYHRALNASEKAFTMRPTFRADKAMSVQEPAQYNAYLDSLEASADQEIGSFGALISALGKRHAFFSENGCRLSDHGLYTFHADPYTQRDVGRIFSRVRSGKAIPPADQTIFQSALLYELAVMDHDAGWTQQFHYGALRNVNSRMHERIGPDTGYDSMGDPRAAIPMGRFFDRLAREDKLARTIVYNLNPSDNEMVATMTGNFQDGSVPGKMQFGSGWWFLDQKDGIEKQLNALSNMGLLSRFVGMLTDSRSYLSYPRHEYFRRILCNLLGTDMEYGLVPLDYDLIGKMVQDICYYNAKNYFGFHFDESGT
jgi:glucuronate isomerase